MRAKCDGSGVVSTAVAAGDWVADAVFTFWHAAIVVATHAGGLGWQLALAAATLILQLRSLTRSISLSLSRSLSSFLSVCG